MPSVNMAPGISVRTIICYSGSKTKFTTRSCRKLYLKNGPLVVSIANSPRVTLLNTYRATLTALVSYPVFLNSLRYLPSVFIRKGLVLKLSRRACRKYTNYPLTKLCQEAYVSMELLRRLCHGGRLQLSFSQNAEDLLINLHTNVCSLINYYKNAESIGTKKV